MPGGLPIVGVIGSGVDGAAASTLGADRAERLGSWLAAQGVHLLTGGGGGLMAAASRGFHRTPERRGLVIGILPGDADTGVPPAGYPNPWVEVVIRTHLPTRGPRGTEPSSRNHINILTPAVIVALPGGPGTASEVELARRYRRPLVAYLDDAGQIPGLPDDVPRRATLDAVSELVGRYLRATSDGRGSG